MLTPDFFYSKNEYLLGFLYFLVLAAAGEVGFWAGQRMSSQRSEAITARKSQMNTVQTIVFAVLGLLLAFTFSMAVSRFDARRQTLVDETNAIGTAYLRSQLLPEPERSATVALWREYLDTRIASGRPNWYLDTSLQNQTSSLQQQLWSQAVAAGEIDQRSVTTGLYIQALNDAIDAQGTRDAARLNTLPATVLYLLYAVSAIGMGVHGYAAGLEHGQSFLATLLLALILVLVAVVIIDMDRPYSGFITVSQQSLIQLRQTMGNAPRGP